MTRAKKLGLLSALYLAQGLPFGFQATALPIYLRERGLSLTAVGFAGALSLPWVLKALWAPLVDRYHSPAIGRRRSWLIPLQVALVLACALTALVHHDLTALLGMIFVLNLLAATQDIAVDGLAVDLLTEGELGLGNAAQVCGYKVGMIAGGGLLVLASSRLGFGWTGVFVAMGALTALVLLVVLLWREPPPVARDPSEKAEPPVTLKGVLTALRLAVARPQGLWLLLFIGTYRAGESLVDAMFKPFLVDAGFTKEQLAEWLGTYGLVAGLVGSLAGGLLASRLPVWSVLFWAALLRCVPLALQAALADAVRQGPLTEQAVIVITCVEHFASGVLTTSLFAFMMSRVDRSIGASHYTLLASVEVLGKSPGAWASGILCERLGYGPLFSLGALSSVVLVTPLLALRGPGAPLTGGPVDGGPADVESRP